MRQRSLEYLLEPARIHDSFCLKLNRVFPIVINSAFCRVSYWYITSVRDIKKLSNLIVDIAIFGMVVISNKLMVS